MLVFGVLSAPWPAKTPLYYRVLPFSNPCKKRKQHREELIWQQLLFWVYEHPGGQERFCSRIQEGRKEWSKAWEEMEVSPLRFALYYYIIFIRIDHISYYTYNICTDTYMYWYLYVLTLIICTDTYNILYIYTHQYYHTSYIIYHTTSYNIHNTSSYIIYNINTYMYWHLYIYIHTHIIIHHISHIIQHT